MFKALRIIGLLEGTSFLILLGVAMPLKYMAGMPQAVRVAGSAHGLLFLLYAGAAVAVSSEYNWPFKRLATALIAAVLPLGTFVFDKSLAREQSSLSKA